jgi:hypothetical protein
MDATNVFATQGATVLLIPLLVQWMKNTESPLFRWLSSDTAALNRAIAWGLGVIAAVGIHWVGEWHGAVLHLTIDFSEVTLASVLHQAVAVGGQLGGQQVIFRILRSSELLERVVTANAEEPSVAAGTEAASIVQRIL